MCKYDTLTYVVGENQQWFPTDNCYRFFPRIMFKFKFYKYRWCSTFMKISEYLLLTHNISWIQGIHAMTCIL